MRWSNDGKVTLDNHVIMYSGSNHHVEVEKVSRYFGQSVLTVLRTIS